MYYFPPPSLDTGLPAIGNNSLSMQQELFLTGETSVLLQWVLCRYVPGRTFTHHGRSPAFYTAPFLYVLTHCSQDNSTQYEKVNNIYRRHSYVSLYLRTWETHSFQCNFPQKRKKMRKYCSHIINRDLGGQVGCQDLTAKS